MTHKMAFNKPASLAKINRILLLLQQPMTAHALALAVPMSKRWVHEYLRHLHDCKRIHIKDWARDIAERKGMYPRELWLAGEGVDAPRPPALTLEERTKRAWKRLKDDEEKHATVLAKRRVMRRIARLKPDPASAWIRPINDSSMQEAA